VSARFARLVVLLARRSSGEAWQESGCVDALQLPLSTLAGYTDLMAVLVSIFYSQQRTQKLHQQAKLMSSDQF